TTVDAPIEWIKYLTKKTDVSISFIGEDSNNEVAEFYRMDTHILPKKDSFKRTYFEDERDMSEYLREIGYFEYDLILRNKYYEKIGLTDLVLYKGKVHAIEDVLSKSWDNINLTENAIILIDNKPTIV